ncbi:Uma2 family endonuclease [Tolypothrix sp. PCC 7910]|uniref:Uma2 family endonuclease n=1 Tax=Tolypothrix sp. PCC 7910 TaxID=2099387 RepID=UPI00142794FE|nr:Uma2 family endonuclease [Tolypothrix sp. PCC 7910]QIR36914.1 Uma2 family endonuclease [Tolypothrix sp. PCC 7910]
MSVSVPIQAIELTPGSQIMISNLSWQDFEQILTDLGEKRSSRVTYYRGILEIMSPLALHERPHRIIADIVKAILDIQKRDWEDFGSTTLKSPEIAGIEPDTCFYIKNADRVQGCTNLDLTEYPPPDLAIESDVTSKTTLDAYEAMGIPEVWIYRTKQLKIYLLSNEGYVEASISPIFPDLPLTEVIPQMVQKAIDRGTSKMLRDLKTQFRPL